MIYISMLLRTGWQCLQVATPATIGRGRFLGFSGGGVLEGKERLRGYSCQLRKNKVSGGAIIA